MKSIPFLFSGSTAAYTYENAYNILVETTFAQPIIGVPALQNSILKMTAVAEHYYKGTTEVALEEFAAFKKDWQADAEKLLTQHYTACYDQAKDLFTEVEWLLYDAPVRDYNYYHDQIVPLATLTSTLLFSYYIKERGIDNVWVDPRDIIRTDDQFTEAKIDPAFTDLQIQNLLKQHPSILMILPAGVGATDENENTTGAIYL